VVVKTRSREFVLLYGVHGNEAMGARAVVASLASLLPEKHGVRILGPVMPWTTARSYRFDGDLVDPNRVFATPSSDPSSHSDRLEQVWQLWNDLEPSSPEEMLMFIQTCHKQLMPMDQLIRTPQFSHPGLPGFSLSPHPLRYQMRIAQLAERCCMGLAPDQPVTLVDVHLGVGLHGRTVVHGHDRDDGVIPKESMLHQLQQVLVNKGFSVHAVLTETGTESNLHGLLALLQELAHRSRWGQQRQVPLRPLIGPTWCTAVQHHLLSDLRQNVLPILL
jgi:hypothetical protein